MENSEEYYDVVVKTVENMLCKNCMLTEFEDNCSECKAYKAMFNLVFDENIYNQYKKMEKEDEIN